MTKKLAIDVGYGFVKGHDGTDMQVFPSVVGAGRKLSYTSDIGIVLQETENIEVLVNNKHYFIGDLAIRQSETAVRSLNTDKRDDKNTRILFMATIAQFTQWESEIFNIVTGLPANYFAADDHNWNESLIGEHQVSIRRQGEWLDRIIKIGSIRTIPQPFGTLFDLILNEEGTVKDKELSQARIGIIDIGFKTSDYALADKMELIPRLSHSSNTGISLAYSLIANALRESFGVDKENHELDRIIQESKLRISGREHDISSISSHAFQVVAEKILTEVESLWNYRDLDAVLLTGGGSQMLGPYLATEFPNIRLVKDPQTANVRGYWNLANAIF